MCDVEIKHEMKHIYTRIECFRSKDMSIEDLTMIFADIRVLKTYYEPGRTLTSIPFSNVLVVLDQNDGKTSLKMTLNLKCTNNCKTSLKVKWNEMKLNTKHPGAKQSIKHCTLHKVTLALSLPTEQFQSRLSTAEYMHMSLSFVSALPSLSQ